MRIHRMAIFLAVAAAALLAPAQRPLGIPELRVVDGEGRERPCEPGFARVVEAPRDGASWRAFLDDLSLAAAAGGVRGCLAALAALALLSLVAGCWTHGFRGGFRRVLLVVALGAPVCLALLYHSCFLDGRGIALGPAAAGLVPASLHTQTHHTTGLLSPRDLVVWHARRGFRVLNVSDKDGIAGALEAREAAKDPRLASALTVIVGEEAHGNPHLLLVNVRRAHDPRNREELLRRVREEGGAIFVAHPWSHRTERLEEVLALPLDGVELVNEAIYGGEEVKRAAARAGKTLIAVVDYKFGPHVTAATLLPEDSAESAEAVIGALRAGRAKLLYAVPGGASTGVAYAADAFGLRDVREMLRSLVETSRARRATWLLWLLLFAILWKLATRREAPPGRTRGWRALFALSALLELLLLAGVSWQVRRALGPVPVALLLVAHAAVAVPLLASAHKLACASAHR